MRTESGDNVDIYFATEENLDSIAELYVCNHKKTYRGLLSDEYLDSLTVETAKNRWADYLCNEKNKLWTAFDGKTFLGFVAATEDEELENTWYLDSLHVNENARGIGVGTALIKTVTEYAVKNGYESMSICVVKGNEKAKNLYLKLGAEPYKDFEDNFGKTHTNSEKLIWKSLT